jgi:hypothetical protein
VFEASTVKNADTLHLLSFIKALSQPPPPTAPAGQIPSEQTLTLIAAPYPYQRARYTSDLKKGGRSVFVEGNESIVLEVNTRSPHPLCYHHVID